VVIQCSMDESHYRDHQRVFAVSAIFAKWDRWQMLIGDWQRIFKSEGIKYFKSSDCGAVNGEFRKFRRDERRITDAERRKCNAIRHSLLMCFLDAKITVTGFCVNMDAWEEVVNTPERLALFKGSPFYYCYLWAMMQCAEIVKGTQFSLAFAYDQEQEHGPLLQEAFNELKRVRVDYAPYMRTIAPFNDHDFVPIQAADLIASIIRQYAAWKILKPRPGIPHEWKLLREARVVASVRVSGTKQLANDLREGEREN